MKGPYVGGTSLAAEAALSHASPPPAPPHVIRKATIATKATAAFRSHVDLWHYRARYWPEPPPFIFGRCDFASFRIAVSNRFFSVESFRADCRTRWTLEASIPSFLASC